MAADVKLAYRCLRDTLVAVASASTEPAEESNEASGQQATPEPTELHPALEEFLQNPEDCQPHPSRGGLAVTECFTYNTYASLLLLFRSIPFTFMFSINFNQIKFTFYEPKHVLYLDWNLNDLSVNQLEH